LRCFARTQIELRHHKETSLLECLEHLVVLLGTSSSSRSIFAGAVSGRGFPAGLPFLLLGIDRTVACADP
jgi:hypothetical protein